MRFLTILFLVVSTASYAYNGYEHYSAGAALTLKYLDSSGNEVDEAAGVQVLLQASTSSNTSVNLTLPMILYLSGDFLGDPTISITGNVSGDLTIPQKVVNNQALTTQEQETITNNFLINFNYLYGNKIYKGKVVGSFIQPVNEAVMNILESNAAQIADKQQVKVNNDTLYNCYTGGACPSTTTNLVTDPGLYLATSSKGVDHFGPFAARNYLTGHKLALETAIKAKSNDELNLAYAYEASADHYLSDSFTPGHMRTPAFGLSQLPDESLLNTLQSILQSLGISFPKEKYLLSFAKIMHENENQNGLWVNTYQLRASGVPDWQAFGDGNYFVIGNEQNVSQLHNTLQHGIDQIFEAYKMSKSGQIETGFVDSSMTEMATWLPDLSYIIASTKNPTPLFFILNINNIPELFENGYRDYPDGSTGSICAFARNSASIVGEDASRYIRLILGDKGYCRTVIAGFAKAWDYIYGNNNQMDIYYGAAAEGGRQITTNEFNSVRYVRARTQNQQAIYVYPTLVDKVDNIRCTFRYPIQLKRYGMYTSLDRALGNNALGFGVYLARDFLDCGDGKYVAYYSAASTNFNNFFGFTRTGFTRAGFVSATKSYNVKLCTSGSGQQYLTHSANPCTDWE